MITILKTFFHQKICDFGLARGFQPGGSAETGQAGFMTECERTHRLESYLVPDLLLIFRCRD
jgi:hypothetical protein